MNETFVSRNLAQLELGNLDRLGIYTRLHSQGRSYTNLKELEYANALAEVLREHGVEPGDRVLLMSQNSPELTASFQAIWTIGAVAVPVTPQWTAGEAGHVLRDSGATVVLATPSVASRLEEAAASVNARTRMLIFGEAEIPAADDAASHAGEICPVDRAASDLALLLYTSGTTGKPKGVMITHGNFLAALDSVFRLWPKLDLSPMLHALPLTHVYGLLMLKLANGFGLTSVLLPHFDPVQAFEAIERYRVQYMPVVPTMLVYLLHHSDRARYDLSCLKKITSGGAPLAEQLRMDFEAAFACRIEQGYGLSESLGVATSYGENEPYRSGSAGRADPGVEICIMDSRNAILPHCSMGEICLAGPHITPGYWRDPGATHEAFSGKWLHTGDIGYLDEEGYLFITDRKKDLIIKGGENISPREIEEALYLHPSVAQAAVIGVPDRVFGEEICAVLQLKPGMQASEAEIRRHARRFVTKFKVPSRVVFLPMLPKNSNGKILKREIRAQLVGTAAASV